MPQTNRYLTFSHLLPLYALNCFSAMRMSLLTVVTTPIFINGTGELVKHMSYQRRLLVLSLFLCLYPLGQFLTNSLLVKLSNKYGRRKILLFSGFCGSVLYGSLSIGLAYHSSFMIISSLFLSGLSDNVYVSSKNVITDYSHNERDSLLHLSYLASASVLGFIAAPMLATLIEFLAPTERLITSLPFAILGLLLLTSAVIFFATFKESNLINRQKPIRYKNPYFQAKKNLIHSPLASGFRLNLVIYFVDFLFVYYFPIYLSEQLKLNIAGLSAYFILTTISTYIAGTYICRALYQKLSLQKIIQSSLYVIMIATAIFMVSQRPLGFSLGLILFFIAITLIYPAALTLLTNATQKERRAVVIAECYNLELSARFICSLLSGTLASLYLPLGLILILVTTLCLVIALRGFKIL